MSLQEKALELRKNGGSHRAIAAELGVGHSTVGRWLNPSTAEASRRASAAAKDRLRGVCRVCGGETRYNEDYPERVAPICQSCARKESGEKQRAAAKWPPEKVLEAIRAWVSIYGRPPAGRDWSRSTPEHPGTSLVIVKFGTWNKAIEAAGFTPRRLGSQSRGAGKQKREAAS